MNESETYKYNLQYQNNKTTISHTFSAFINSEDIKWQLRDFLCACGWNENIVRNDILRIDDVEVDSESNI